MTEYIPFVVTAVISSFVGFIVGGSYAMRIIRNYHDLLVSKVDDPIQKARKGGS